MTNAEAMDAEFDRSGFTLIELLVTVVIRRVIVFAAGQVEAVTLECERDPVNFFPSF